MRGILLFSLVFFLISAATPPKRSFYVDVPYESQTQFKTLIEEGWELGGIDRPNRIITLVVPEEKMDQARSLRTSRVRAIPPAPDSQYKRPDQVEAFLKTVERNYPHLAYVRSIGKSLNGKEIYAVKLGNRFVANPLGKKVALFDAMHHAREVMTVEVALDIVNYLTQNYDSDPQVQKWMNQNDIWVVPMVNPDGNNIVWSNDSMWRKNARGGYGVDINRNYPTDWNTCNGSSGNRSDETFRGDSAASEPETQALMALASQIKPTISISYHSFSEIVIYPYGCKPKKITDNHRAIYEGVGKELANLLVRDSGSGSYDAGTSYELLYNVDGGSLDWMYSANKTMAFVIEVNGTNQGFQPSYSQWREISVQRQRKGWQFILDKLETTQLP